VKHRRSYLSLAALALLMMLAPMLVSKAYASTSVTTRVVHVGVHPDASGSGSNSCGTSYVSIVRASQTGHADVYVSFTSNYSMIGFSGRMTWYNSNTGANNSIPIGVNFSARTFWDDTWSDLATGVGSVKATFSGAIERAGQPNCTIANATATQSIT
jgi:hypothetical protein